MRRRNAQIGRLDLPDLDRFEPVVGLQAASVLVVGLRRGNDVVLEEFREGRQILVLKAGSDLNEKKEKGVTDSGVLNGLQNCLCIAFGQVMNKRRLAFHCVGCEVML